jgi:hypothetical protein
MPKGRSLLLNIFRPQTLLQWAKSFCTGIDKNGTTWIHFDHFNALMPPVESDIFLGGLRTDTLEHSLD